ncbi:MAG: RNA-directed DNA polymerase [Bacteroidetes bacterium]|nr:RNA-directed DNA polymerase [Bacteroidota bacterium]
MKNSGITYQSNLFHALQRTADLEKLLHTDIPGLIQLFREKPYQSFYIPKKNGGRRLIENPKPVLKEMLKRLNLLLQCSYLQFRPKCVYGFTIRKGSEKSRNIISNARRHVRKKFLLNIDLKEFFHSVKENRVRQIFESKLGKKDPLLVLLLSKLVTLNGRLPMGSPTSPVISNLALLDTDWELEALCSNLQLEYTRFADDLSFSSNQRITTKDIQLLKQVIRYHGFEINREKVKLYGPEDTKWVTGLIVEETVKLPPDYLLLLEKEIFRFKEFTLLHHKYKSGADEDKIKLIQSEIRGKWNFANMVIPGDEKLMELQLQMEYAFNPVEEYESTNWLDMPYTFF